MTDNEITIDELTPAEKRAITAARKLETARTSPTFPLGCKVRVVNPKVPKYDNKVGIVRVHVETLGNALVRRNDLLDHVVILARPDFRFCQDCLAGFGCQPRSAV